MDLTIIHLVKLYLASLFVFLALDAIWLGVVARQFYRDQLGDLMRPDPRWGAAALFYALFVAGVVAFVTIPAITRDSVPRALLFGALFGLVTYATYDLTNLAVLRGFPVLGAVVDLAWGATISAAVAASGVAFARWIGWVGMT